MTIDLGYFFEIEFTDKGFPAQSFNHNEGGEIYIETGPEYTVIDYPEKGVFLKMENKYYQY